MIDGAFSRLTVTALRGIATGDTPSSVDAMAMAREILSLREEKGWTNSRINSLEAEIAQLKQSNLKRATAAELAARIEAVERKQNLDLSVLTTRIAVLEARQVPYVQTWPNGAPAWPNRPMCDNSKPGSAT